MANTIQTFVNDSKIYLSYEIRSPLSNQNLRYSSYLLNLISDMTLIETGNKYINNPYLESYIKYNSIRNYITPWIIGFGYMYFRILRKVKKHSFIRAASFSTIGFGSLYYILCCAIFSKSSLNTYLIDGIIYTNELTEINNFTAFIKSMNTIPVDSVIEESNI